MSFRNELSVLPALEERLHKQPRVCVLGHGIQKGEYQAWTSRIWVTIGRPQSGEAI